MATGSPLMAGPNEYHGLQPWLYSIAAPRLSTRNLFSVENGSAGEQPLLAGAFVVVVVEEFEISVAQFEQCNVRHGSHFQRTAVVEDGEGARRICRGACDGLWHGHAEA